MESIKKECLRFPDECEPEPDAHDKAETAMDTRLMASIASGDQQAFSLLYKRHGAVLYSLLTRMLGNEMEAQECLQDAFMSIWRRAGEFDPELSSPLAWMVMIARSRGWDRLRARRRRQATQAAYESEVISLEVEINLPQHTTRDELSAACASAVNGLPEEQSRALQLAFFRGWTHEEIAGATGEPLGTIKARIRRGLLALRKTLKDHHA